MAYTRVDGVRIYYEEAGKNGPPLLLIHGAAQDTLSWRYNIPYLSRFFHVYAIDLPGHGKSQLDPDGPIDDLEAYAVYAEKFMDSMNCARYVVAGHSMAGGIALYMALHRPESVLLAVLVDGACCTSGTYGDDVFELVSLNPTDWFEVNFRTICSPHTAPERIEEIAFDVRRCAPEVAFHDIKAYAALDLQNQMKNIPAPLVFLHGEDDWSIPPELGRRTAALAAGRTVFTALQNVGHFPHTEHPEAFNTAFVEALQSIDFRLSAD